MLGKTISHYKVLEKIGSGGMGDVYRATDTKLNRDVALKILPQQFASDSQRMARFQREAEAAPPPRSATRRAARSGSTSAACAARPAISAI